MKKHPLVESLLELRGNPRACVYTEPLWGIPYNLYMPFASVFMAALMVTDRQIGIVASVVLFSRAVSAFLSGALTDKLGRKWTSFFYDVLAWSIPCLIWVFSRNFWWFIVAGAFNGMWQITHVSWNCLMVEDAPKSQLVNMYNWVHISGQMAVFFAPIAGLLVDKLSVVPAVRILYMFSFLTMTAKFIILYLACDETEVGKVRLKETKDQSLFYILSGYKELLPRLLASREMRLALILTILFQITRTVMDNFFGLYATQNLSLDTALLAYFPIIRSGIILLFIFGIQSRLSRFGFKGPMLAGVILYIASHLMLILSPTGNLSAAVFYTILEACAHGLVIPRKDSLVALYVDKQERARMTSIMTVIVLAISIPFGYLSGLASSVNRRLPFILNITVFVIALAVIFVSKGLNKSVDKEPEGT